MVLEAGSGGVASSYMFAKRGVGILCFFLFAKYDVMIISEMKPEKKRSILLNIDYYIYPKCFTFTNSVD